MFATAGMVAGLSILVKGATAARELLVAWYFGTSDALDAYLIGYAVPYFLITLIGASLPQVLVPTYVELRVRGDRRAAAELLGHVVLVSVLALSVVTLAIALLAPVYLPGLGHGFSPLKLDLSRSLILVLAPTVVASVLTNLAGSVLNAHARFMAAALSPMLTTCVVILALLGFATQDGVFALAFGLLLGTTLEACLLGFLAWRAAGPRLGRVLGDPHLLGMGRRFASTLIGAVLMASTLLIDQAMSAGLPSGSVAALNYANRLVTVPLGLTAAALGTVVLPHFSNLAAEKRWSDLQQAIGRYLRLTAIATLPAALFLALLAGPLVQVLLLRGAFNTADADGVASSLAALALQIPFYTGVILLMRLALALRLNVQIAIISLLNLVLDIALNAALSRVLGVAGIALATSIVYAVFFLLLLAVTSRRLRQVTA